MLHKIRISISTSWSLGSVMEYKGKQELYEKQKPEVLKTLREMALIQSAESSNRIEGVTVERRRLAPLVFGEVRPKDRSEEEIVGYRKALQWIHAEYDQIEIIPKTILKLHKLAQGGFSGDAGKWKEKDNEIIDLLPNGGRQVRFKALPAKATPRAMEQLCLAYQDVTDQNILPPLLAAATMIFDFLCIHPFRDGNGRVSRLLTLLLAYQNGYRVGRYISLERLVEQSKETYYEVLAKSSAGWHGAKHDLAPWWNYFLSVLKSAYKELAERVELIGGRRGAKTETIVTAIEEFPGEFSIFDIEKLCPNVSREMIRNVLRGLRNKKKVSCSSLGRNARWYKVGKKKLK